LIQEYIYPTQQGLTRQGLEATTAALSKQLEREIKTDIKRNRRNRPAEISPEYIVKCIKGTQYMMCPVNHIIRDVWNEPPPEYPGGEWKRPVKPCCSQNFQAFGSYVVRENVEIRTKAQWTKAENEFKRNGGIPRLTGADQTAISMLAFI